jgi:hypothetical protein
MKAICFLLLVIASTVAFPESYGRDPRLIGHWKYVENSKLVTEITFRQDGTFSGNVMTDSAVRTEL